MRSSFKAPRRVLESPAAGLHTSVLRVWKRFSRRSGLSKPRLSTSQMTQCDVIGLTEDCNRKWNWNCEQCLVFFLWGNNFICYGLWSLKLTNRYSTWKETFKKYSDPQKKRRRTQFLRVSRWRVEPLTEYQSSGSHGSEINILTLTATNHLPDPNGADPSLKCL